MTTQLSTKSRSVHPLLGDWKLDETVPVVFEILLHTISTLWAEASVSLTLWRTKCSLDHFKSVRNIDLSWDFFFFLHLIINGQFMPIVQVPALGRQRFDGLFQMSSLAIRDMVLCTLLHVQPSLHAIDCFWQTHCDEMLISSIELGLAKKLHQLFLHLIFLYLSLFLPSSISVVRCCYESSFMKITRDVRFLSKKVNTKTQTFQSGNHERVELVLLLGYSWGSIEGCCILMLKCFYTCS